MNITISIHGWQWAELAATLILAAFLGGFFGALGRELGLLLRSKR